ncbi:MAG TPA: hypothetical protein VGQ34_04120 [Sphingomicrobium sp.]|jgi:hypothetical protein|nr:hypothetical protein [Sphingomicrobium sp.]
MKAAPARVNPLAGPQRARHVAHMTGKDKEREERLAAALRENLKRRKAQLRKIGGGDRKDKDEG